MAKKIHNAKNGVLEVYELADFLMNFSDDTLVGVHDFEGNYGYATGVKQDKGYLCVVPRYKSEEEKLTVGMLMGALGSIESETQVMVPVGRGYNKASSVEATEMLKFGPKGLERNIEIIIK